MTDVKLFEANFPLFYRELLGYFQELSSAYGGDPRRKFILWNNKDKLFNECSVSEPTGIKKWKEHFPNSFLDWRSNFIKIYQITKDNKLRQLSFKILHRVIITKKELKRFNIASDVHCNLCSRTDSIMHSFLECDVSISLLFKYHKVV